MFNPLYRKFNTDSSAYQEHEPYSVEYDVPSWDVIQENEGSKTVFSVPLDEKAYSHLGPSGIGRQRLHTVDGWPAKQHDMTSNAGLSDYTLADDSVSLSYDSSVRRHTLGAYSMLQRRNTSESIASMASPHGISIVNEERLEGMYGAPVVPTGFEFESCHDDLYPPVVLEHAPYQNNTSPSAAKSISFILQEVMGDADGADGEDETAKSEQTAPKDSYTAVKKNERGNVREMWGPFAIPLEGAATDEQSGSSSGSEGASGRKNLSHYELPSVTVSNSAV